MIFTAITTITGLALVASAAMVPAGRAQHATAQVAGPSVPALQVVAAALGPRLAAMLSLTAQGTGFQVQGVVNTRADLAEVNLRLDNLPGTMHVARRYTAAPDVVDMVMASVPGTALSVERTGQRRFTVSGHPPDVASTRALIEQLGGDLQTLGIELDTALTDAPKPNASMAGVSGMLIDPQGVSFSRTRDGVKHLVVQAGATQAPPPAEAQARPPGATP